MKKNIVSLFLLCNFFIAFGQAKVCETSKENVFDENLITLSKCTIEANKSSKKKVIVRKRIVRRKSKKLKSNILTVAAKKLNLTVNNYNSKEKIKLTQQVLFTLVEHIPIFVSCKNLTRKENVKCFKQNITKHFKKHFSTDEFIDESIKDRVFIQFNIDISGKVTDAKIKTTNKKLKKELHKVIEKLPIFSPGYEKEIPVIVAYSFPFNLTLN